MKTKTNVKAGIIVVCWASRGTLTRKRRLRRHNQKGSDHEDEDQRESWLGLPEGRRPV